MKRRIGFKDHTYIFKALFRACIKILFLLCIFVHPYGIKTVHAGGGAGGQKMAKFYPRSCWLPPNARSWSCLLLLLTPCWSVFFEKSSSTNWIFSLFGTWFLLPVYPTKINFKTDFCSLKIQFVELDFYNLIFQKSNTDLQFFFHETSPSNEETLWTIVISPLAS